MGCNSYICHDKHDSLSLQRLGPLLRLSTKYGVEDWRKRIIAFFEAEWPTNLKGWDTLEIEIDSLIRSQGLSGKAIDEHLPEPGISSFYLCEDRNPGLIIFLYLAYTIRLGRECDVPSILPAAFYHLFRIHRTKAEGNYNFIHRKANRSLLTAEDFDALISGVHIIRYKFVKMLTPGTLSYHWLYPNGSACVGMDSRGRRVPAEGWWGCEERLNDWWTRECTPIVLETQLVDPLDDLKKLQHKARGVSDGVICAGCQTHLIGALEEYRERLWSDLPQDFLLGKFILDLDWPLITLNTSSSDLLMP